MQETEFVHHVTEELEIHQRRSNRESVLLFPSLPSRLRYLIHKKVEDLPELSTFSVGESWCRRVVVCHAELRAAESEEEGDLESGKSSREEGTSNRKPSITPQSRTPKRPDKPLYMPRAARERLSLHNSQEPPAHTDPPSPPVKSCSFISSSSKSRSSHKTTANTQISPRQESAHIITERVIKHPDDVSAACSCEEEEPTEPRLDEADALLLDQTASRFTDMTLGVDVGEEDLADVPFDAQMNGVDADDVTEEIKARLKETVSFFIEHVQNDFSIYENVSLIQDGLGHVIEIYDFPPLFKTEDLLDAFREYSDGGMKITWVDDTHALGVFSSEPAAVHALSIHHPLVKVRPLTEGSKKAKGKAMRRAEFILPVKERPRTDCAVARRMLTRALGLPARGRGKVLRY